MRTRSRSGPVSRLNWPGAARARREQVDRTRTCYDDATSMDQERFRRVGLFARNLARLVDSPLKATRGQKHDHQSAPKLIQLGRFAQPPSQKAWIENRAGADQGRSPSITEAPDAVGDQIGAMLSGAHSAARSCRATQSEKNQQPGPEHPGSRTTRLEEGGVEEMPSIVNGRGRFDGRNRGVSRADWWQATGPSEWKNFAQRPIGLAQGGPKGTSTSSRVPEGQLRQRQNKQSTGQGSRDQIPHDGDAALPDRQHRTS